MGGIDESSLDRLSLVTQMTKKIRVCANEGAAPGFDGCFYSCLLFSHCILVTLCEQKRVRKSPCAPKPLCPKAPVPKSPCAQTCVYPQHLFKNKGNSCIDTINNHTGSSSEAELSSFTPSFLWLLRDFYLRLEAEDGRTVRQQCTTSMY